MKPLAKYYPRQAPPDYIYVCYKHDSKDSDKSQSNHYRLAYRSKDRAEREILPFLNSYRIKLGLDPVRRYYENSVFRILQIEIKD